MSSPREDASQASDKHEVEHTEKQPSPGNGSHHLSDDDATFEVDEESLPPGYFKTPFFLGTMTAIGLGLMAGVAGYGYAAPILSIINADIGPVSSMKAQCLEASLFIGADYVPRTKTWSGLPSLTRSRPPSL